MLPTERTTRTEVATLPGEVEALIAAPGRAAARPLVEFLKREGLNVQLVVNADTAFEEALLHRPNVILIDDRVPPAGGIELCQRLKSNTRTHFVPSILFAQSDVRQHRLRALAAGADAIFVPATDEQERRTRLWALLRTQALYRRQEKRERSQGSAIQDRRRWVGAFVHDLQSSMGALQANFEYLSQMARGIGKAAPAELDECITDTQTVFRQVIRGLRTVLDFERFEDGRIALRHMPVSLGQVVADAQEEVSWQAASSGKTIELETSSAEASLRGDPEYLKEALVNLMSFTLRQPSNRRATIAISSEDGTIQVRVGGDGDRIAPEDRTRIFEPYGRPAKQAPVGHGVGLALAKAVVELHGGSLWVEDLPHAGSAFIMELKNDSPPPRLRTVE